MRKTREILRLKWIEKRRNRHIARALQVGVGTVSEVTRRAATAGLTWDRVAELGEVELEAAVYGEVRRRLRAPLPEPQTLDLELKKPGVTLQLLHVEYREKHPDGYGYTQFCEHYRRWKKRQRVVMRQAHRAGEKLFTDFAGKKPLWIDPMSGEVQPCELFVAVLGGYGLPGSHLHKPLKSLSGRCQEDLNRVLFDRFPPQKRGSKEQRIARVEQSTGRCASDGARRDRLTPSSTPWRRYFGVQLKAVRSRHRCGEGGVQIPG